MRKNLWSEIFFTSCLFQCLELFGSKYVLYHVHFSVQKDLDQNIKEDTWVCLLKGNCIIVISVSFHYYHRCQSQVINVKLLISHL